MKRFLGALSALLMIATISVVSSPSLAGIASSYKVFFSTSSGPQIPPANVTPPVVSGEVIFGYTLTSTSGTWTGEPTPSLSYQWRVNGSNISGATSSTYVVAAIALSGAVDCLVTATNASGSASADSNDLTPWSPASLPGLRMWLDASDLSTITDTGTLTWADKSGNGNNATQSVSGSKPTSGTVTINGLNAFDLDGTDDFFNLPVAMLTLNSGQFTAVTVNAADDTTTGFNFIAGENGGTSNLAMQYTTATNFRVRAGVNNVAVTVARNTSQHVFAMTAGAAGASNVVGYYDGSTGTGTATKTDTVLTTLNIGRSATFSGYFNGKMAEFVVTDGVLSKDNLNRIGNYMKGKWATPWINIP